MIKMPILLSIFITTYGTALFSDLPIVHPGHH